MKKPKRGAFRVNIPGDASVYMTYGKEWFKHKHEVLDLSEGGFRFIANAEVEEGKDSKVFLHFPWLSDPMQLKINAVRVIKKEIPVERPKSEEDEEGEEEPPEPEMRTIWEVACRFEGLTIGMQDKVFHQVRQMERWHIMSDRARAEQVANAKSKEEEASEQPSENQPSTT